jgi:hypothetical protein
LLKDFIMKISTQLFICFFAIAGVLSCKKQNDFNYAPGTVGISKIVYFPSIAIKGDRLIILNEGGTYTDPGVTALLNGNSTQYSTAGSVNTSMPGVYVLSYTAVNPQGFSASDFRTVVVIGNDVAGNDFSGTYARTSNNVTSTWTKTSNGVYTVENPGGATSGVGDTVTVVNYSGTSGIAIPQQIAPAVGQVSSSNASYSLTPSPQYSWVFNAGGYGTSLRTFIKQ